MNNQMLLENTHLNGSKSHLNSKLLRKLFGLLCFLIVLTSCNCSQSIPTQSIGIIKNNPLKNDSIIIEQAKLIKASDNIELYLHNVEIDEAFFDVADKAFIKLEQLLNLKFTDLGTGTTVKIYVSDLIHRSHVWKGYSHMEEPKPILFIPPRVVHNALNGDKFFISSLYAHEMAHLFTPQYNYFSHSLREGIATYLAEEVHPGESKMMTAAAGTWRSLIPNEVIPYIGTNQPPAFHLFKNKKSNMGFFIGTYQFVKFLVEKEGLDTFMKLYASSDPEQEYKNLYNADLKELRGMAGL